MRDYLDVDDLSVKEIQDLISVARNIRLDPDKYRDVCRGKKLATLFYEPSTRTRLSFTAAMMDLGGNVFGFSSSAESSVSKGESVADTVRVISRYADIIAMRTPTDGAAYVASRFASIPVINAGDGVHAHPTQTLADLMTIYDKFGSFENLTVGFCGDLKYGRTVHSLIHALLHYKNIRIVLISPLELRLPDSLLHEMEEHNVSYFGTDDLEAVLPELDVLYMTRIQRERFSDLNVYERLKDSYILTKEKMELAKQKMIVLHPLPRVNEISVAVDEDKRACYFDQVENGKLMRMALIMMLLDEAKHNPKRKEVDSSEFVYDLKCDNPRCIVQSEQELPHAFKKVKEGSYCCIYCEVEKK